MLGLVGIVMGANAQTTGLTQAWETLSYGFYDDAGEAFARAGDSREARLGAAIAKVNSSPVTAASLADAQRQLSALVANDEIGRTAHYFLGRLHQLHPIAPDPIAAAREFEALVATAADDAWCRLALVKLAILRLTTLPGPDDPAARVATVRPLFEQTTDPATRRDLHLVVAEVCLRQQRYDAATREHLLSALAAPSPGADVRADLLIQIARVSQLMGDAATARDYYERFVRDYPRDRRRPTVELILAGGETPGPR
ncbi:MAG: hypothetical protein KF897_12130 [Opitutaceae bacterium]|nr:hypothetical protein [Opitutaceae bacterium]